MKTKLNNIFRKGKTLILAYDQGLEHGPIDFNDKNVDPKYIINIAKEGKFTALAVQRGIAEKYQEEIKNSKVPLILKLNGKTSLVKGDPISAQISTVNDALSLNAAAVGFTLYIGSIHEEKMMEELRKIEKEAHSNGLPVVVWLYPRGSGIKGKSKKKLMAYATRVALEIGVDVVKVQPHGELKDIKWAVDSAGKTKVVCAGGAKRSEAEFLKQVKMYMKAGVSGLAVGRNIWQSKRPIELANKLSKILWQK